MCNPCVSKKCEQKVRILRTFVLDDKRSQSLKHGDRVELNGDVVRLRLIQDGRRRRRPVCRETTRRQRLTLPRAGTRHRHRSNLVAQSRPRRVASRQLGGLGAGVFRPRLPDERGQRKPNPLSRGGADIKRALGRAYAARCDGRLAGQVPDCLPVDSVAHKATSSPTLRRRRCHIVSGSSCTTTKLRFNWIKIRKEWTYTVIR